MSASFTSTSAKATILELATNSDLLLKHTSSSSDSSASSSSGITGLRDLTGFSGINNLNAYNGLSGLSRAGNIGFQAPGTIPDPSKAQRLLSDGGVDLRRLQKELGSTVASIAPSTPSTSLSSLTSHPLSFPPSTPSTSVALASSHQGGEGRGALPATHMLMANDVAGYLNIMRDHAIVEAIAVSRDETQTKWRNQYATTLAQEWEGTKRELLAQMGVHASWATASVREPLARSTFNTPAASHTPSLLASSSYGTLPRTLLDEHSANYARIVSNMVSTSKGKPANAPAIPTPYIATNFLQEFENLTRPVQEKGGELNDVWKLLSSMVGKAIKTTAAGSAASQGSLRGAYERRDSTLEAGLTEGSLAFLQDQYANLIEAEIARQPTTAKQGGVPGEDSTIRAYLNVIYSRAEHRPHSSLMIDNVNAWAYVYFMLRCGWIGPALKFVERHKEKFGSFYTYFNEYVVGKRKLSVQSWESCCKEFNSNVRADKDPYKLTVWNLVSRCDVNEFRAFRAVISSTQDFIWYKLMLVSSDTVQEKMKAQELRLVQVQQQLSSLGPSHFNPAGRSPFIYLFVLLSVQLYEQGIAFLYSSTPYQTEAIHMAIALHYYGLLREPQLAPSSEIPVELLLASPTAETAAFNFPRLIHDYASRLIASNPIEALTYCALLDASTLLQCVSDIVFNSGDLDMFLGRKLSDNNKQEGLVERFFPKNQMREIQLGVANQCQASGKTEEAVKLYEVAEEPEAALQLLIRQLSKLLASRSPDRQRLVHLARDVHKRMSGVQYAGLHTPSLAVAFEQLLSLDSFFELVAAMKFSEALNHMSSLGLIPFLPMNVQSCTATFHRLHEAVKRLFPEMLSTTMQLLTHQHSLLAHTPPSPFDNGRAERDQQIRQAAKALVTFAGTIQYLIPKDLTAQLLSSELIIQS